ncbi:MAG TPA: hypothetical protein DCY25_04815 [Bacteroidales bacterium]|nr:hypothetical protein [Bacteroidales bacterium]
MDEIIRLLKTPEECEQIARLFVELSNQARRKAIELRALSHGNERKVETELLKAIYAYEDVLAEKNKRRTKASRTWQMVKRHGIIEAAQRAANRPIDAPGYKTLVERGLEDLTFEAIIVRFPENFKKEVVEVSKRRLEELKGNVR